MNSVLNDCLSPLRPPTLGKGDAFFSERQVVETDNRYNVLNSDFHRCSEASA